MKLCESCHRIARFVKTEQRGSVAVDVFECCACGQWEDYRILKTRVLTLAQVQARLARLRERSRIAHRLAYHRNKQNAEWWQRYARTRARLYRQRKAMREDAERISRRESL